MVFLKRMEINGFKSYAEHTNIFFKEPFVGLIGPNGSGKSNIVDAIRWVLGENSNKELRGDIQEDVLFKGNKKLPKATEASVTLYISNQSKKLRTKEDELKIQRVYKKDSETNEYFLNDRPVRRKDIIDLFLDTGLSKGSLGIIAQGAIQAFVDAKPEERRKIFEEAAGVGKYIKSKNENIVELEKVQADLQTLNLNLKQYENSIDKLQKQANQVKHYMNVKEHLDKTELFYVKKVYQNNNKKLEDLASSLNQNNNEFTEVEKELTLQKNNFSLLSTKRDKEEETYRKLNDQKIQLLEQINELSQQQATYEQNLKNQLSSSDKETKILGLKQSLSDLKNDLIFSENNILKYKKEISDFEIQKKNLSAEILQNNNDFNFLVNQIIELNNKIARIKSEIDNEFSNQYGLKILLENKSLLPGLINPLKKLIKKVDQKYALAIETALGKNINNMVTETVNDAKMAVDFLKKNNAGIVSFMPLNGLKYYDTSINILKIAESFAGFVNTADKLVNIDENYVPAIKTLIGNVLIVDNLNTANALAKALNYNQRIITLEGDIIKPGGIITGGSYKKHIPIFNIQELYDKAKNDLEKLETKKQEISNNLVKLNANLNEVNTNYIASSSNLSVVNQKNLAVKQELKRTQDELSTLKIDNIENIHAQNNEMVTKFKFLHAKKDELDNQLIAQNKICQDLILQTSELSKTIELTNNKKFSLKDKISKLEQQIIIVNNALEKVKAITTKHKMTIDFIVQNIEDVDMNLNDLEIMISNLKAQLEAFGPINMQSVQELEDLQKKYDELKHNISDVEAAEIYLKDIISNLDKEASKLLEAKIKDINETLPEIFHTFKPNEKCFLSFTNPNDILKTGIDVELKHENGIVKKLRSLSGGEKSVISLSVLLAILKTSQLPLVVLDEVDSALDKKNSELLANLIKTSSKDVQFLFITHEDKTMVQCDKLIGFGMQEKGITSIFDVNFDEIMKVKKEDK